MGTRGEGNVAEERSSYIVPELMLVNFFSSDLGVNDCQDVLYVRSEF